MNAKKIAITLMLISLLPLTMSMIAVFFSGSDVRTIHLKGHEGTTAFINIEPDMSPLRAIIKINYSPKGYSTIQRYIEYNVTAKNEAGSSLWFEDGRASVSSDNKRIVNQSHYSSLQTFDITFPTKVQFSYQIKETNLRYKGGELTLKRNVSRHNWFATIIGLIMLVSGILLFTMSKNKT